MFPNRGHRPKHRALLVAATAGMLLITGAGPSVAAASTAVSAATFTFAVPPAPTAAEVSKSTIGVKWEPIAGAPNYRLQVSTRADMGGSDYYRTTVPSYDIRNLEPGTTYYIKLRVITSNADGGAGLSDYSAALSAKTAVAPVLSPVTNPLKVSSFNLKCANCYDSNATADQLPWAGRRDTVVAQIKAKQPDVIGLQEVSQAWLKDSNGDQLNLSQFEDLQQRLVAAGANYQLTNVNRNNCVNSYTPTNCVWKDQGASQGTKVMYNADTVDMISQGSERLPYIDDADNQRYVAWGIFRQKSSGNSLFFADTHIEPSSHTPEYMDLKIRQAQRIADLIKEKNTLSLPVVIVGDLNSSKYMVPSNGPWDVFTGAGYIDPLGNDYGSTYPSGKATAEKRINAEYNSFNGFVRTLKKDSNHGANGRHLDYIFTSPMRFAEWEMVLNKDANDNLVGIIPADHNMILGTVQLPATAAIAVPVAPTVAPTVAPVNAGPSLNAMDTAGRLWAYSAPGNTSLGRRTEVASKPDSAKQALSVDWNNDGELDLVVRGADGYLSMHAGTDTGSYLSPVTIGFGGWQSYDIAATKFRTSDTYPGLIARDAASGNLFYYPNTAGGELTAPRSEIGTG
ncbi:MAG TPA: endonuclease/exonuclease/phosphatase family protein, partial [Arthrobacter sp.]